MVSRLSVLMLQANEVQIVDTQERCEAWILRDGRPHALVLSGPLEKRAELEEIVRQIKQETGQAGSGA